MENRNDVESSNYTYVGSELDLFSHVHNWKAYWYSLVRPYIKGDVLEVGAGLSVNTRFLSQDGSGHWVCLEPDSSLSAQASGNLRGLNGQRSFMNICGTLATLPEDETFDTVIYIDVLEHIEDDKAEMRAAAQRLRPSGRIIVLSPAHNWLFSPFDAAIGHFRRYDKALMRAVTPKGLKLEQLFYADSFGLTASAANRLLLKQAMPTRPQLATWDKWIVPVSRIVDPLVGHTIGKSIIGVWHRPAR